MWVVNGENWIRGAESREFPPHSRRNVSWFDYVEHLGEFIIESPKCGMVIHPPSRPWRTFLQLDHPGTIHV